MDCDQETVVRLARQFGFINHFMRMLGHGGQLRHGERGILRCLMYHGEVGKHTLRPSQISAMLGLQQSTVTPQLRSLEEKGLVHRRNSEQDRREVFITITELGRAVLIRETAQNTKAFEGLCAYLGAGESEQLAALLEKATQYLAEQAVCATQHRASPESDGRD